MKAKNVIGVGLAAAAAYYLCKEKNNRMANAVAKEVSPKSPKNGIYYYSYYSPKSAPKSNTSSPSVYAVSPPVSMPALAKNVPGYDGTPYRDSKFYFGDKTQAYDEFYDYSDDTSLGYLGIVNDNLIDRDIPKYNAIRYRILGMEVKSPYWGWCSGTGYDNVTYLHFNCFYITTEVFNPFNIDILLKTLTPTKIRFNDVYMFPYDISKVNIEKIKNYDKGVKAIVYTDFTLMDKLKVGVNLPSMQSTILYNCLGSMDEKPIWYYIPTYYDKTTGLPPVLSSTALKKRPNDILSNCSTYLQKTGNKMLELRMIAEYGVYENVPFTVNHYCYPDKETIIDDKPWQHQVMPAAFFEAQTPYMQFPTNLKHFPG